MVSTTSGSGGGVVAPSLSSPHSIQPASSQATPVVSNVRHHNQNGNNGTNGNNSNHHQYRRQRALGFTALVQQNRRSTTAQLDQHHNRHNSNQPRGVGTRGGLTGTAHDETTTDITTSVSSSNSTISSIDESEQEHAARILSTSESAAMASSPLNANNVNNTPSSRLSVEEASVTKQALSSLLLLNDSEDDDTDNHNGLHQLIARIDIVDTPSGNSDYMLNTNRESSAAALHAWEKRDMTPLSTTRDKEAAAVGAANVATTTPSQRNPNQNPNASSSPCITSPNVPTSVMPLRRHPSDEDLDGEDHDNGDQKHHHSRPDEDNDNVLPPSLSRDTTVSDMTSNTPVSVNQQQQQQRAAASRSKQTVSPQRSAGKNTNLRALVAETALSLTNSILVPDSTSHDDDDDDDDARHDGGGKGTATEVDPIQLVRSHLQSGNMTATTPLASSPVKEQSNCWWLSMFHKLEHEHQLERETWARQLQAATTKQGLYKSELKQNIAQQLQWLEERVMAPKHVLPGMTSKTGSHGIGIIGSHSQTGNTRTSSQLTASTSESTMGSTMDPAASSSYKWRHTAQHRQPNSNNNVMQLFVEEDAQILSATNSNAGIEVTFDSALQIQRLHEMEQCLQETLEQHQRDRLEWLRTLEDAASVTAAGEQLSAQQQQQLLHLQSEVDVSTKKQRKQWKEKTRVLAELLSLTEQQHATEKSEWQSEQERLEAALSQLVVDLAELRKAEETATAESSKHQQAASEWMQKASDMEQCLQELKQDMDRDVERVRQEANARIEAYQKETQTSVSKDNERVLTETNARMEAYQKQMEATMRTENERVRQEAHARMEAYQKESEANVKNIQRLHQQASEVRQKEMEAQVNQVRLDALAKQHGMVEKIKQDAREAEAAHHDEMESKLRELRDVRQQLTEERERQAQLAEMNRIATGRQGEWEQQVTDLQKRHQDQVHSLRQEAVSKQGEFEQHMLAVKKETQKQMMEKEREKELLQNEVLAQKEQYATLQTEMDIARAEIDRVTSEVSLARLEATTARDEAEQANNEIVQAREDFDTLQQEMATLRKQADEALALADKAREEAQMFKEYAADFTEQATISRKQCSILQKNLAAADSPLRASVDPGDIISLETRSGDLGDKMDRAVAERDLYLQEAESLQRERFSLKEQLVVLESEIETLKQQSQEAQSDRSLSTSVREAEERDLAVKYKETIERHAELVGRLKRIEEQRDNERGSWKLQLEAALAELRSVDEEKLALERSLLDLAESHAREVQVFEAKMAHLEQEPKRQLDEFAVKHSEELSKLHEQMQLREQEHEAAVADLQEQIRFLSDHVTNAERGSQELLHQTHAENTTLIDRIDELSKSLSEYKRLHNMAVKKYERALSDRNGFQQELEAVRRQDSKGLAVRQDVAGRLENQQSTFLNAVDEIRNDIFAVRETLQESTKADPAVELAKFDELRGSICNLEKSMNDAFADIKASAESLIQTRDAVSSRESETMARIHQAYEGRSSVLDQHQELVTEVVALRQNLNQCLQDNFGLRDSAALSRELVVELQQKEAALATAQTELRHAKEMLESEIAARQVAEVEIGALNDQADSYEEEITMLHAANTRLAKKLHSAGLKIDAAVLSNQMHSHDDFSIPLSVKEGSVWGTDTSLPVLDEAIALAEGLTNIVHGRGQFEREASALEMLESMSTMIDDHDNLSSSRRNKTDEKPGRRESSMSPRKQHRKVYDDFEGIEVVQLDGQQPIWVDDIPPVPVQSPANGVVASDHEVVAAAQSKNDCALHAVVEQLYVRCQLLERERVDMMEATLDLLESARDANAAELEVALATARRKSSEEIMRIRDQNRQEQERIFHKLCNRIVREGKHLKIETANLE